MDHAVSNLQNVNVAGDQLRQIHNFGNISLASGWLGFRQGLALNVGQLLQRGVFVIRILNFGFVWNLEFGISRLNI